MATTHMTEQVRVGVGVFVLRPAPKSLQSTDTEDIEFIIGKRKGSLGSGSWALAGGHLETGESFETCAARETLEETGLEITNIKFFTAVNTVMVEEQRHYVTIFMTAQLVDPAAEPRLMEPDKCDAWEWISWKQFREWAEEEIRRGQIEGHGQGRKGNPTKGRVFAALLALTDQRPGIMPTF